MLPSWASASQARLQRRANVEADQQPLRVGLRKPVRVQRRDTAAPVGLGDDEVERVRSWAQCMNMKDDLPQVGHLPDCDLEIEHGRVAAYQENQHVPTTFRRNSAGRGRAAIEKLMADDRGSTEEHELWNFHVKIPLSTQTHPGSNWKPGCRSM